MQFHQQILNYISNKTTRNTKSDCKLEKWDKGCSWRRKIRCAQSPGIVECTGILLLVFFLLPFSTCSYNIDFIAEKISKQYYEGNKYPRFDLRSVSLAVLLFWSLCSLIIIGLVIDCTLFFLVMMTEVIHLSI